MALTIKDFVINFFEQDDWYFEQEDDTFWVSFDGDNGKFECYLEAREDEREIVFYSICPVKATEEKKLVVAELLCRVNFGITIGNFELDFNDGEIRYKTSMDVEEDKLSFNILKLLIYRNVMNMDKYLPAINNVIYNELNPSEIIEEVE